MLAHASLSMRADPSPLQCRRIDQGGYRHPDEFLADVRLVFDNARLYNKPGSDVHVMANTLQVGWGVKRALLRHALENAPPPMHCRPQFAALSRLPRTPTHPLWSHVCWSAVRRATQLLTACSATPIYCPSTLLSH